MAGYSDYELFVRTGGIFDRRGNQIIPHVDRTRGLLDHLRRRPKYEFIVWTDILRGGQALSGTMSRRVAPREISSPEEWKAGNGIVRVDGMPLAIFRGESTHSITAFLNHRVRASQSLRERSTSLGITGLRLAEASLVRQLQLPGRKPWQHTPPRTTVFQNLPRPNPAIEPEAFAKAIDAVTDDPEESIHVLCDAFERQLGKHWPKAGGTLLYKRSSSDACSAPCGSRARNVREMGWRPGCASVASELQ